MIGYQRSSGATAKRTTTNPWRGRCFFIRKSPIRAAKPVKWQKAVTLLESEDIVDKTCRHSISRTINAREEEGREKKKGRKEKEDRGAEHLRFEITTMGQFFSFGAEEQSKGGVKIAKTYLKEKRCCYVYVEQSVRLSCRTDSIISDARVCERRALSARSCRKRRINADVTTTDVCGK